MSGTGRRRTTIDLRDLSAATFCVARNRGLTVSAFVRLAVAAMLPTSMPIRAEGASPGVSCDRMVKVTLRMPISAAKTMSAQAQALKVSNGTYLAALIRGAPPPDGVGYALAAASLSASTDLLAHTMTELNGTVREGSPLQTARRSDANKDLVAEVRSHLRVACRLVAELQPLASWRRSTAQGEGGLVREDPPAAR